MHLSSSSIMTIIMCLRLSMLTDDHLFTYLSVAPLFHCRLGNGRELEYDQRWRFAIFRFPKSFCRNKYDLTSLPDDEHVSLFYLQCAKFSLVLASLNFNFPFFRKKTVSSPCVLFFLCLKLSEDFQISNFFLVRSLFFMLTWWLILISLDRSAHLFPFSLPD